MKSIILCFLFIGLVFKINAQKRSKLMPDYSNHPCIRPCEMDGEPMECEYRFVVESYETMSRACYNCLAGNLTDCRRHHCVTANGFPRNIKTVNREIPGPTIQVCEGDTIIVNLENYFAMSEGVTIHWHGILQRLSPHMDGVGMITQCPIQSGTTFQYKYLAIDPGTHFWHAHTGLQRGEGMYGDLVVRQAPELDPHSDIYDFDLPEHVIVLAEWQNKPLIDIFTSSQHSNGGQQADSILIDGRAQDPSGELSLPRSHYFVEPGMRHRFRIINAGSMFCPLQLSIDDHNLTLIASDGRPFDPFDVPVFDTYSAERYDFILTADQPPDSYWLRVTGLGACSDLQELAVIRYLTPGDSKEKILQSTNGEYDPKPKNKPTYEGRVFNTVPTDVIQGLGDVRDQIVGMNATAPDDRSLTGNPDHQFIMSFSMNAVENLHYFDPDLYPANEGPYSSMFSPQINGISNRLGPVSLLAQMDEIPQEMFCNGSSISPACATEWCECVHKLTVRQDELVELVFLSPSGDGFTHPVHVHGFSYRVVAMDRSVTSVMTPELFQELDARGEINRKLSRAPFKDTVPIINGGYTIIRFVADNPGVWFAHCHLAFHAEVGMAFALEVLQPDGKLPPAPPNFPTCRSFVAPILDKSQTDEKSDKVVKMDMNDKQPSILEKMWIFSGIAEDGPVPDIPATGVNSTPKWVYPVVTVMAMIIVVMGVLLNLSRRRLHERKGFWDTFSLRSVSSHHLPAIPVSNKRKNNYCVKGAEQDKAKLLL